jgi:hypothetical protein
LTPPQAEIDGEIARLAFEKFSREMRGKAQDGDPKLRVVCHIRGIAKTCLRDLGRDPWHVLTAGQRKALLNCLTKEDRERLSKPGTSPQPECLKRENLPMKPPGRS